MNKRLQSSVFLVVFSTVGLAASQHSAHSDSGDIAKNSSWSELAAAMGRMHASMRSTQTSGDPDVDFVALMLPHHEAAIDMARTELLHGTDPQMRRLAQEIIADQQSE